MRNYSTTLPYGTRIIFVMSLCSWCLRTFYRKRIITMKNFLLENVFLKVGHPKIRIPHHSLNYSDSHGDAQESSIQAFFCKSVVKLWLQACPRDNLNTHTAIWHCLQDCFEWKQLTKGRCTKSRTTFLGGTIHLEPVLWNACWSPDQVSS